MILRVRIPDIEVRNIFKVFISSSDIVKIKVVHSEQMVGVIGKQAITVDSGKVF